MAPDGVTKAVGTAGDIPVTPRRGAACAASQSGQNGGGSFPTPELGVTVKTGTRRFGCTI